MATKAGKARKKRKPSVTPVNKAYESPQNKLVESPEDKKPLRPPVRRRT